MYYQKGKLIVVQSNCLHYRGLDVNLVETVEFKPRKKRLMSYYHKGAISCGEKKGKEKKEKIIMLMLRCHQLLPGLLIKEHLLRVSSQSRLSANVC